MTRRALTIILAVCSIVIGSSLLHSAYAATITFDEFPATNNGVPLTILYTPMGVTFGPDNSGTWDGLSGGDPGNWGLEGTNGTQFLGNNGANNASNYITGIFFSTPISSFAIDASRSNGSSPGQTLTAVVFSGGTGGTLLGSTTVTLGGINSWTTISLSFAGIDTVILDGSQTGFSPYGLDNLQFDADLVSVPEPTSPLLLMAGLLTGGLMVRRRPRQALQA